MLDVSLLFCFMLHYICWLFFQQETLSDLKQQGCSVSYVTLFSDDKMEFIQLAYVKK